MKLLFAITLLLVLSQIQAQSGSGNGTGSGHGSGGGSGRGGGGACDAAGDICGPEFDAMMSCTSDECTADAEWMNGSGSGEG